MSLPASSPLTRVPRAVAAIAALDASPFGVLWVDFDGNVGYANKHAESLLGWTPAELLGQKIPALATHWSVSEWQNSIWQKAGASPLTGVEGSWQRKTGGSTLLTASLTRLQVAGQDLMTVYLTPPSKAASSTSNATTNGHPSFMDAIPAGVCFVNADLEILQMNPALGEILGADPTTLIGQKISDLIIPADEVPSQWHQLASLGLKNWNIRYRNPQGHTFDLFISSRTEVDAMPWFLVVVQDVSERVQLKRLLDQHEHSFEHLARNTPGMIYKFTISPDGQAAFPYASPGSQDIWEVDPAEVREDATPIIKLVHPDDIAGFQASVMKSAAELSPWEFEGRMITPSGKLKWFHAASRPELAETGHIVWQGLLMDVTHQKAIEEELKVAKLKAESAARSKADFLANMSHEIRTPMNGVIGMSELLANTELAPRQKHYVETIRSSAEVLLTIINDILDISKMEAGKLLIHPAIFDLRRTLDDVATLLAPRAFDKGIDLIVRYAPNAPQRVNGDAVRIRQVLTNLIGNAIKFTTAGHVLVQVKEVERINGKAKIHFSVTDTGIGISPEAMPRLFQKFEQEDSSTSRKFGGTGLGLAISRQLVELMQGELNVTSKLEVGSTFAFDLKLEVIDQEIDDDVISVDLTGLNILAVDDHPVNREVLSDMFEAWGIRHTEVESGEAALKALRESVSKKDPFDVALLDFQMPGMDGVFLATAIRAEPEINDIILLMLSSASFNDDQQRQLAQAGVSGQLLKPLRQFELREVLSSAVQSKGIVKTDAPKISAMEKKTTPSFVAPQETSGLRVLLAEDNEVNVEIALEMLKNLGFHVDCAVNGIEAVTMTRKNGYDLIFMDCQMPEMDGFEATKAIRSSVTENPPIIIAMTAHAMAGDRERCLDSGMDDYLAKPVTFLELSRVTTKYAEIIAQRPAAPTVSARQSFPLFDLQAALSVTGGSRTVLRKATAVWWRKVPDWLTELKTGFQRGDVAQIRTVSHTMRGAAANIGAISICKTAETLETQITSENIREMSNTFDHLVLDIERLRSVVIEDEEPPA